MGFEDSLAQHMFNVNAEKTFIDKVLARQDVEAIRDLVKKPKLNRSDMLEMLYLLSGVEAKLCNYGEWDRYIILKFFVWIREFIKIRELLFDYRDMLNIKSRFCSNCRGYTDVLKDEQLTPCHCETPKLEFKINDRFDKMLSNCEYLMEHNAKFMVDLYLNIARTSLSIGATGFLETLKNKFEIDYPQGMLQTPLQDTKPGLLGIKLK
jgi:hypothetical protein